MKKLKHNQIDLLNALKWLPIPDDSDYEAYDAEFIKQQRESMIICIMLDAIQCDCVDDVLKVVNDNYDKSVFDIMKILVDKGIGSSVEIVDDDELEDDE